MLVLKLDHEIDLDLNDDDEYTGRPIDEILPSSSGVGGLYIGGIAVAENLKALDYFGIKAVLSAANGANVKKYPPDYVQFYLPIWDSPDQDVKQYFDQTNSFIAEQLQKTNVLVHCFAGVSRSATIMMAYLMKHQKMSYSEALQFLQQKRRVVNPNFAFKDQLKWYEEKLKTE